MMLRNVIFDKVFLQSVKFAERENGGMEGTLRWHYMMKCLFELLRFCKRINLCLCKEALYIPEQF